MFSLEWLFRAAAPTVWYSFTNSTVLYNSNTNIEILFFSIRLMKARILLARGTYRGNDSELAVYLAPFPRNASRLPQDVARINCVIKDSWKQNLKAIGARVTYRIRTKK